MLNRLPLVFLCAVIFSPQARSANNQVLLQRIEARAKASGSDSLIVVQNGHTLFDSRFSHREKLQEIQSVTKSICAVAIGILLDRGAIRSVDAPMSTWIPSWRRDPMKSKITLKMIMSQTSGLPDDSAIFSARDRIAFAEHARLVARPGEKFIYSAVGSALLQRVISRAAGMSVTQFVDRTLFLPLDIQSRYWGKDQMHQEKTGGVLAMRPSDLLKIGEVMLDHGKYHGRQIISPTSIAKIRTKSQNLADYGLLWWLKNPPTRVANQFRIFFADGWGGQYIVVYPAKHLVAVRTRDPETESESNMAVQGFGEFPDMIAAWQ